MKVNYHTHTYRCLHAQGTEEDYVISAIKSGVEVLGLSDHAPFPGDPFDLRMKYSELDEYLKEIDSLSIRYQDRITLKKGLEIEYLPSYTDYYEDLLNKKDMDYLLLGEHFYEKQNEITNIYFAESTNDYIDYANAIAAALCTGYFKVVAHPDLCFMGEFKWDRNCDKACDTIIEAAAATNTILEYNANGLRRGIKDFPDGSRYQYPHDIFWNKVAVSKVAVVVGSDCHNPIQVWDDCMKQSYINLEKYGIKPVYVL